MRFKRSMEWAIAGSSEHPVQLLIVALTTLVLPWAGCQYARELESALRVSQENSLLARQIPSPMRCRLNPSGFPAGGEPPFDSAQGDLYVYPLHNQPLLDGYREDWGIAVEPRPLPTTGGLAARRAGFTDRICSSIWKSTTPHSTRAPTTRIRSTTASIASTSPCSARRSPRFLFFRDRRTRADRSPKPRQGRRWNRPYRRASAPTGVLAADLARVPSRSAGSAQLVGSRIWMEAIDGAGGYKAGFPPAEPRKAGNCFRDPRLQ